MDNSNVLSTLSDMEINTNKIIENFQENEDFNEITSFVEPNNNLSIGSTENIIGHDVDGKPGSGLIVRLQRK